MRVLFRIGDLDPSRNHISETAKRATLKISVISHRGRSAIIGDDYGLRMGRNSNVGRIWNVTTMK